MPFTSTLTVSALFTELTTDPVSMGYAPFVSAGNDGQLAAMLNDPTLRPTASTTSSLNTKDILLFFGTKGIAKRLEDQKVSGSDRFAGAALAMGNILISPHTPSILLDGSDAEFMSILSILVSAGVMNSNQRDTLISTAIRIATRAEEQWGRGIVVNQFDIAAALRGNV